MTQQQLLRLKIRLFVFVKSLLRFLKSESQYRIQKKNTKTSPLVLRLICVLAVKVRLLFSVQISIAIQIAAIDLSTP